MHTFRNIYNNFLSRDYFIYPGKDKENVAKFSHIRDLFRLENEKPLKLANTLLPAAMNPANIQKTSTKLAAGVFNDKVICAMRYYNSTEWHETVEFIDLISKWWKIVNVLFHCLLLDNKKMTLLNIQSTGKLE